MGRSYPFLSFLLLLLASEANAASYYVQLGAYRNPQNANLSNANALGQVEQVAGPNGLTRVRVVGIESKSAASEVLQGAKHNGFSDAYIGQSGQAATYPKQDSATAASYIPAYAGPSDQRMSAARAKVGADQYGDIVYLDGKLFLKEGENFRPLE